MIDRWHILPVNDLRDHVEHDRCWCRPEWLDGDEIVLVHNSMDGRESYEQGRRLH